MLSDEKLSWIAQEENAHSADAEAILVERYEQLVQSAAQSYAGYSIGQEELTSPAYEGLLDAIRTFPKNEKLKFKNHAFSNIKWKICKYLRFHIKRIRIFDVASTLAPKGKDGRILDFFDIVEDPQGDKNSPSYRMQSREEYERAHALLSSVPEETQQILRMRHGFDGAPMTRPEIQAVTGKKRVERIEARAYEEMRLQAGRD